MKTYADGVAQPDIADARRLVTATVALVSHRMACWTLAGSYTGFYTGFSIQSWA